MNEADTYWISERILFRLDGTLADGCFYQATDSDLALIVAFVANRAASQNEIQWMETTLQSQDETLCAWKFIQSKSNHVHVLLAEINIDGVDHKQIVCVG